MTDEELLGAFRRNADGSWTALVQVQISPSIRLGPGMMKINRGALFSGIDLAALLDAAAARRPDLVQT